MEKITTKAYNNSLESKDSLSKVKAVDTEGNDILVSPRTISQFGACGIHDEVNMALQDKWYRIAFGKTGNTPNCALLLIGNHYSNEAPNSQLLYIHADGYSNRQSIVQLANSGKVINKARILYQASTVNGPMIDILVRTTKSNQLLLSYSCNLNFTFQSPVEVPAEPDAGYLVKEFAF